MSLYLRVRFSSTLLTEIDREGREYRLFSCNNEGEMKHVGNFDDLESAKTCADLLDLSKN